jgi:cell division protease FtsH
LNDVGKNLLLWLITSLLFLSAFSGMNPSYAGPEKISFDTFIKKVEQNEIKTVEIDGYDFRGTFTDGTSFTTVQPLVSPEILDFLVNKDVTVIGKQPEKQSLFVSFLIGWFPILLLIGLYFMVVRNLQGGGRGAMSFGKSKARMLEENEVKVNFKDVAGVDEAKQEVQELVDFLRSPERFQKIGGKIPKGVLMVGPPGTGKTLLAKAIAGEAEVPFFSISGSDFVEMFVGVGASRVRDMFEQARKHSPCIIFIDEIDAVGRQRGAGLGGGHDEREQTLNQLLVEMDGFEGHEGIIVIAATNRPDVLDKALLRPGRFDRRVTVNLPDLKGRCEILKVHLKKILLANPIDAMIIARGTPGFSGADLANLVNEAALFAARNAKTAVEISDLDTARDKIIMGPERRSMMMSDQEKKLTAYHEAGHAIVGLFVEQHDPVYKVTIIPRAQALGVTMYLPEEDKYSMSRTALESKLATLFGGRIAEELIFGDDAVTTGASNDIERATEIARNMVTKWGLSEKLGPLNFSDEQGEIFLGQPTFQRKEVSNETSLLIDQEIKSIVNRTYQQAKDILIREIDLLHRMSEALLVHETIDKDQVDALVRKETLKPPEVVAVAPKKSVHENEQEEMNHNSSSAYEEKKHSDPSSETRKDGA